MTGPVRRLPRRPIDRLADATAWLVTLLELVVLIGAGFAGFAVHGAEAEIVAVEQATRTPVTAVLVVEAVGGPGVGRGTSVPTQARWTDLDGAPRTDPVPAPAGTAAGADVTVWLDADGRPVRPPSTRLDTVLAGAMVALSVMSLGTLLVVGLWIGFRYGVLDRLTARYWEREWARVEPGWRWGRDTRQG